MVSVKTKKHFLTALRLFSQKAEAFLRPLIDQNAKEGKDKKVVFECGFSKPNCKPKWTFRKDVRLLGVIEAEVVNNSMIFIHRNCSPDPSTSSRTRVIVIS